MKLSAQDEYGLRCLLAIAREGDGGSLTIPEISKVEGMTPSHVAKLLSLLRAQGFVASTRGQSGGYQLARPASEIVVKDVLNSLGGRLFDGSFCRRHDGIMDSCIHHQHCGLRPLWTELQRAVDHVLGSFTIADLVTAARDNRDPSFDAPRISKRRRAAEEDPIVPVVN